MLTRKIYQIASILLFFLPVLVKGQISQGGIPIQVQKLKSVTANSDLVVMPSLDNVKLRNQYSRTEPNLLKSFHFAHAFKVSLSPKNSGKWYCDGDMNIWQLRIRSVGAYSMNIILQQFNLPEGSRLFIVGENTGEIKGAYTTQNNSDSKVLSIEPVAGDEILVQYEEPVDVSIPGEFVISQVAHDFIGVAASGTHRPLGISGSCNINVNCDVANGSEYIRDAVCRLIIEGTEICTGTLVNNTAKDGIPYLITANHCVNSEKQAQLTVFLFNYESPYCGSVDGDISRSLSGSSMKASFDSLDFSLVRLNNLPPFNYRTYLAGWNKKNVAPTSSMCIHHPLGDIKKVSIDQDAAVTSNFNSSYLAKGFWNILRWDKGVTEEGSSGGPLFDQNKQLVGTLTGGSASCTLPTNDYFEKFALAWNYRNETAKQLKAWLDPIDSGVDKLDGMFSYTGKSLCKPVTNFKNSDIHEVVTVLNGSTINGYWSGTNSVGLSEFAEEYKTYTNCEVQGITLGIGKLKINHAYTNSYIDVNVYEGSVAPETLLYSEKFDIHKFYGDAMNYLPFKSTVKTHGNFFVSYNVSQLHSGDTLAVYMANRKLDATNSFYLKKADKWVDYNSQNLAGNGSALLTELIACNIDDPTGTFEEMPDLKVARFYPNPLHGNQTLNILTAETIDCPEDVAVYDLLGKKQNVVATSNSPNSVFLNFSGRRPGIYVVQLESGGRMVSGRIVYMP